MDDQERERRVAATELRQQAVRDAVPEGPGLVLSERELLAVALVMAEHATIVHEDVLGALLKTSGGCLLSSSERCSLSEKIEEAALRARASLEVGRAVPLSPAPSLPPDLPR
jgi:hypothetical protein